MNIITATYARWLAALIVLGSLLCVGSASGQVTRCSLTLEGAFISGQTHGENWLANENVQESGRYGFGGGVGLNCHLLKDLYLISEILVLPKGAVHTSYTKNAKTTLRLTMIEFPVVLQVRPTVRGSIQPEFLSGLYLAFPTDVHLDSRGFSFPPAGDIDVKDRFQSVEVGIVLGGGASTHLGKNEVLLQARVDYGLTNILRADYYGTIPQTWTSSFLILLGYRINL